MQLISGAEHIGMVCLPLAATRAKYFCCGAAHSRKGPTIALSRHLISVRTTYCCALCPLIATSLEQDDTALCKARRLETGCPRECGVRPMDMPLVRRGPRIRGHGASTNYRRFQARKLCGRRAAHAGMACSGGGCTHVSDASCIASCNYFAMASCAHGG